MFSRSKYNWAVTQIQTSCKFDYAFDEETNDFVSSFLDTSEMYELVNQARKESGEKVGTSSLREWLLRHQRAANLMVLNKNTLMFWQAVLAQRRCSVRVIRPYRY